MDRPPDDFLILEKQEYEHRFRVGQRGQYFWMHSQLCEVRDLIKCINAPASGFRMISQSSPIHPEIAVPWHLGKTIHQWPKGPYLGKYLTLELDEIPVTLEKFDKSLNSVFNNTINFEPDTEESEKLWEVIESLRPRYYFDQFLFFTFISASANDFNLFLNSTEFLSIEERHREHLLKSRYTHWKRFGSNIGLENCVTDECVNRSIVSSKWCLRHHYERRFLVEN